MSSTASTMLKISELAERSGVSAGTIKHYLLEGLLGTDDDVVRTVAAFESTFDQLGAEGAL